VVAIIHSLAHLSLASDDALQRIVTGEDDADTTTAYLDVIDACQRAKTDVLGPMKPFVEAVDKFQLLSVIDEEFVNAVRDTYEAAEGEEATDEFDDYFHSVHEDEIEIATGQEVPDDDELYVNPLYFHALSDIVVTDWSKDDAEADNEGTQMNTTQGRAIAEAVARATLDVPFPIKPIGTDQFEWFDSLTTPAVEVAPISPAELRSEEGYPMTESEFNHYLGDYPKSTTEADSPGENVDGSVIDEIDFEYSYSEAEDDWVARAFVNARKALDDLHEGDEIDLAEIDSADLRQLLVERVHGVDIKSTATMLEQPPALLDIPRKIETNTPDEDVMSAEGKPLPKVLMESFEQHGSFGSVVYNLSETEVKYQLNWHAKHKPVDSERYPHVPDGIDDYSDLWHHYYFWKGLDQYRIETIKNYRAALIDDLFEEFETKAEVERLLSQVKGRLSEAGSTDGATGHTQVAADNQPQDAQAESDIDDLFEAHDIRALLEAESTSVLANVATERSCETAVPLPDIDCPLCAIRAEGCGPEGSCAKKSVLEDFESELPSMVERAVSMDHR
jgi:hypothetical protein